MWAGSTPLTRRTLLPLLGVGTIVFCLALLLYLATAAPTITTRFGGVDGGELVTTALSGGVPHPSGYPSYMLLARGFLLLPWGEAAARLAWLSAVSAALASTITTALVTMAAQPVGAAMPRRISLVAGAYAGLSLAISPRFWSQAIVVEVYALHMLWLSLVAYFGLLSLREGTTRWLYAAAFSLGLGVGTHVTLLVVVPAAGLTYLATRPRPLLSRRPAIRALVWLLAGLSMYCLLPLWHAREAIPSWGDQGSLAGWWAHVSGAEYRYLAGIVPWNERASRAIFALRDLLSQPGLVAWVLALWWGIPFGWRTVRPLLIATATIAAGSLLFAVGYGGADSTVYLLPWTWAWSVWGGLGIAALGADLRDKPWWSRLCVGGTLLLGASLLFLLVSRFPRLNLRNDYTARDLARARLVNMPPGAILLADDDAVTFGTWYVQRALHIRPDILVVDTRLLRHPWYQEQINRQLRATEGSDTCRALLEADRRFFVGEPGSAATPEVEGEAMRNNCDQQ